MTIEHNVASEMKDRAILITSIAAAAGLSVKHAENAIKLFVCSALALNKLKPETATRRNKSDRKRNRANRWGRN